MGNKLKLKSIQFKVGSSAGTAPLRIECPNVLVIIGPNNSGKSQTLREIEAEFGEPNSQPPRIVVEAIELEMPETAEDISEMMEMFYTKSSPDLSNVMGYRWYRRPSMAGHSDLRAQLPDQGFHNWLQNRDLASLKTNFVRFFTRRLDGATRFHLVSNQPTGPLEGQPTNHLWSLFQNSEARAKISAFTQAAFNRFFVVDPTGMTEFRMRLSDRPPVDLLEEQGLDPRAQAFHQNAFLLSTLGDGVKASVGLVAAIHSLPDRILLIDEPEAFLHPTLARRMGRALTQTTRERDASLVVATHSAEFLVGCIQATTQLRLVRLTHETGRSTARTLEPDEIAALMNDPLLRSANALRALFHRGVVVCEADADRAFYEEVNARLATEARGIDDALFMNAQNWQTIPRVVLPLRRLGVPATAIFDLDVLMDKDFNHLWPLVSADPAELKRLQGARAAAKSFMDTATRAAIKNKGLDALSGPARASIDVLLADFARYGLFFVPVGELEGWLATSGVSRSDKAKWVLKVFEYMGAAPDAANYVHPGDNDVWSFLTDIRGWIDNPARLGIPD